MPDDRTPLIGKTLGRYEFRALIGRGGMGEVYRARDRSLDREVALKGRPADVAPDPARLERFQSEAKTVAALNHPNIVQHVLGGGRSLISGAVTLLTAMTRRRRAAPSLP